MSAVSDPRDHPDNCPGALTLHEAVDGPLARIRVPGGQLSAAQFAGLAQIAAAHSDGSVELTSRGNLQLRGVHDASGLERRLRGCGLLPSRTHERVRNIVASPLTGRVGGVADVRPLVRALDDALCSDVELAHLPGRFLISIDDGRGDLAGLGADVAVRVVDEGRAAVSFGGSSEAAVVPLGEVVESALEAARKFLELRESEWRVAELPDGAHRLAAALGLQMGVLPPPAAGEPPVGWLAHADGGVSLAAVVPLGSVSARQAEFLAAVEAPIVVTPWRSLIVCDLEEWVAEQSVRVFAPLGLVFDAGSPWASLTACVGAPRCAKAHADVRADAERAVADAMLPDQGPLAPAHFSGCERRCGRPRTHVADVLAMPGGSYRVRR